MVWHVGELKVKIFGTPWISLQRVSKPKIYVIEVQNNKKVSAGNKKNFSCKIYYALLTIFGLNGGCTSLCSIFSQSILLKNGLPRMSSSPLSPQPEKK